MKLGESDTHTGYSTGLPSVGERRCLKLVHKRTGAVTYKVEHFNKTFKTLRGLKRHANHLRELYAEEIEHYNLSRDL
jgi:hypothetical protein